MKKIILFTLCAIVSTAMNAQIIKLYNGDKLVKTYNNNEVSKFSMTDASVTITKTPNYSTLYEETGDSYALPDEVNKVVFGDVQEVFKDAADVRQYLDNLYALQYYGLPFYQSSPANSQHSYVGKLDGLTDLYQNHWSSLDLWNNFYNGKLTAENSAPISYDKDQVWEVINQCNALINNIDNVSNLSKETKDSLKAQAQCIMASRYFDLYSVYGGIPYISITNPSSKRLTAEATCDSIVALLDKAINSKALVWKYTDGASVETSGSIARWTEGGARALKAKVLLFNASPIYNSELPYYNGTTEAEREHLVWHGNYSDERWQKAMQACKEFFSANGEDDPGSNIAADVNSTISDAKYHLNGNKGAEWEVKTTTSNSNKIDFYRQAYRMGYVNQGSAEILHSTRVTDIYGSQATYSWWTWGNPLGSVKSNTYPPTEEYAEMFGWSTGQPFNWEVDSLAGKIGHYTADGATTETVGQLFYQFNKATKGTTWIKIASRDPRLYENAFVCSQPETLGWDTGKASGDILELWLGGVHAGNDILKLNANNEPVVAENLTTGFPTGYGNIKYILGEEYHRKYLHWVYLSYDEMLLMYAECLAQTGDVDGAKALVNRVRARVGLGNVDNFKTYYANNGIDLTTKKGVLALILQERACELGMSNNRYYDMIRYKKTDWMTKQLHGLGILRLKQNQSTGMYERNYDPYTGTDKEEGMVEPNRFEYIRFPLQNCRRALWNYSSDPNNTAVTKWLLFPFPKSETDKADGLVQNPGW